LLDVTMRAEPLHVLMRVVGLLWSRHPPSGCVGPCVRDGWSWLRILSNFCNRWFGNRPMLVTVKFHSSCVNRAWRRYRETSESVTAVQGVTRCHGGGQHQGALTFLKTTPPLLPQSSLPIYSHNSTHGLYESCLITSQVLCLWPFRDVLSTANTLHRVLAPGGLHKRDDTARKEEMRNAHKIFASKPEENSYT
jgi:hypothetical protein